MRNTHPEVHVHDGRVRRIVASVDKRQDIFRSARREGGRGVSPNFVSTSDTEVEALPWDSDRIQLR